MFKAFMFLGFVLSTGVASASIETEGYCFEKAEKYKNLMHTQIIADVDLEGGLTLGETTVEYTPDRYALDNLEEEYVFTIPSGNAEDGFTDLKYKVTIETWIGENNEAYICDVISFSHFKKVRFAEE